VTKAIFGARRVVGAIFPLLILRWLFIADVVVAATIRFLFIIATLFECCGFILRFIAFFCVGVLFLAPVVAAGAAGATVSGIEAGIGVNLLPDLFGASASPQYKSVFW
jgi:hypothetical protein